MELITSPRCLKLGFTAYSHDCKTTLSCHILKHNIFAKARFVKHLVTADAIEKDLEYIRSAKEVKCNLYINGDEYSIGNEKELLVFRIVQEAIANAIKHARPTAIDVALNYAPAGISVIIQDNGVGFDTSERGNNGIGLNNMHVRTEMLQGKISVTSVKEKGTTIKLDIVNTTENVPV